MDEKLIQELDAIVIIKPKLVLIEYNWPIDYNNEVNLKKALDQSQYVTDTIILFNFYRYTKINIFYI